MISFVVQFIVKEDSLDRKFMLTVSSYAESFKQFVEQNYHLYSYVLRYIWKKRESDIRMEPLPNNLLVVKGYQDDEEMRSSDVLQGFYEKRKQMWLNNVSPKFEHMQEV